MKNTRDLNEIVEILREDIVNLKSQYNKSDMFAQYYAKALADLAQLEKNALSITNFYKNFRKYLQVAIDSEVAQEDPENYSVEAGLESALDLLDWYYLKCQNADMPIKNTDKLYKTTKDLQSVLNNFVETATERELTDGVKARCEIVIKVLDTLLDSTLNPDNECSEADQEQQTDKDAETNE